VPQRFSIRAGDTFLTSTQRACSARPRQADRRQPTRTVTVRSSSETGVPSGVPPAGTTVNSRAARAGGCLTTQQAEDRLDELERLLEDLMARLEEHRP
jgi:hypothetical protein